MGNKMKNLYIKEFELENFINNKKESFIITSKFIREKNLTQEAKVMVLMEYNKNNELVFRKNIKTNNYYSKEKLEENDLIIIRLFPSSEQVNKSNTTILGLGKILEINDYLIIKPLSFAKTKLSKLIVTENDFTNNILDLFINDSNEKKLEYIKTMFKVYYDSLIIEYINVDYSNKQDSNKKSIHKLTAMSTYLSLKYYLENFFKTYKLNLYVSEPNNFIKGDNTEYDLLILNNKDKYFIDKNKVEVIFELKASGYINKLEYIEQDFIKYINNLSSKYNKNFIYFSYYASKNNYQLIKKISNKLNENVYSIIIGIGDGNNYFIIPDNYNLDKILKEILK